MLRAGSLLVLCSCVTMRSLATGPPAPPKDEDCALRQEHEASPLWRQVGVICDSQQPSPGADPSFDAGGIFDRQEFHRRACGFGGDVVIAAGFCGRSGGIEWHVYREETAPP
jgi:hypothetical protein